MYEIIEKFVYRVTGLKWAPKFTNYVFSDLELETEIPEDVEEIILKQNFELKRKGIYLTDEYPILNEKKDK